MFNLDRAPFKPESPIYIGGRNAVIDFKNQPFSISWFDGMHMQLSTPGCAVRIIDLIGLNKITQENMDYIIKRLNSISHIKLVYKDEKNIHFRQAYEEDLLDLRDMFRENSVEYGGILCCEDSAPNKGNINSIYVLEHLGELVAYVSIEHKNIVHEDMKDSTLIKKKDFNEEDFIYIKQCAVSKKYQAKSLGIIMYEELFKCFPGYSFYSHVSVRNMPSLKLHYRTGFCKIGVYQSSNFHGAMSDYMSDLVFRRA